MNWPSSQDYNEAIQNPAQAFGDGDLAAGQAIVGPMGLPLPRSGNFADVYQIRGIDTRDWAVKCFTRPATGLDERYARVSEALDAAKLPFTIDFAFLSEGIRVAGVWRPAVKMEWVEGLLLNQVVRENAGRPAVLTALTQLWVKLCRRLRDAGIAHADLQHGNVLLVPGSRSGVYDLKLIDYDGMYVPALANRPPGEGGHAAYQHPARTGAVYSPDLDRFPHLVVATALRALGAGGADLWARYDNGDNLLFSEQDFRNPAGSKLMRELWGTGEPGLRALVGRLAIACGQPIPQTPWLDQIAPDGEPITLDAGATREAETALGPSAPRPISKPVVPAVPTKPTASVVAPAKPTKPAKSSAPPAIVPVRVPPVVPAVPKKLLPVPTNEESESDAKWTPRSRPAASKSMRVPLAIAGIVSVLIVVGVIVFFPKSKPADTAQNNTEDTYDSGEKGGGELKHIDHPKPKDPTPIPIKPKDPDPIPPPKPKDPDPTPLPKPKESPPVVWIPVNLKPQWTVPVDTEGVPAKLHFDSPSQVILAGSERTSLFAIDFASGAKRSQFVWFGLTGGDSVCPLDGGRIAKCLPDETEVLTWDLKTAKPGEKYPVPEIPPGAGKATHTYSQLSPDGRYLVVARSGLGSSEYPAVPFRVFDTKSGKPLLSTHWVCGSTHFTADSTRLLVAEMNGRFRWFKLPSGEPDGEWDFGIPAEGRSHAVTSISAKGLVIGYNGPVKSATHSGPCLVDGKTGELIHRFDDGYSENSGVVVSADGRFAALLRGGTGDQAVIDVVMVPKADVIARAQVATKSVPTFTLSDRGETLLVHDAKAGKLYRFDLPIRKSP